MSKQSPKQVRLQKFLADAGVASRRHAEELILEGRVLVNDRVVDTLPAFVRPDEDRVVANGAVVRPQRLDYFIIHKPKNVVCTNRDPAGRRRAIDFLPDLSVRLFAVGRLDAESTGLLLMTNDGELAERVAHPRYGVAKVYRAEVRGRVAPDLPARMRAGVHLAEGKTRANAVEIVHTATDRSALMITLREGRNRQVRRMLAKLGHPVKTLKRVQIGPLSLRGLPVGAARRLTPKELSTLRDELERREAATPAEGRQRKRAATVKRGGPTPRGSRGRGSTTRDKTTKRRRQGSPKPADGKAGPRRRLIT